MYIVLWVCVHIFISIKMYHHHHHHEYRNNVHDIFLKLLWWRFFFLTSHFFFSAVKLKLLFVFSFKNVCMLQEKKCRVNNSFLLMIVNLSKSTNFFFFLIKKLLLDMFVMLIYLIKAMKVLCGPSSQTFTVDSEAVALLLFLQHFVDDKTIKICKHEIFYFVSFNIFFDRSWQYTKVFLLIIDGVGAHWCKFVLIDVKHYSMQKIVLRYASKLQRIFYRIAQSTKRAAAAYKLQISRANIPDVWSLKERYSIDQNSR